MIGVDEVGRGAWAGPLLVCAARLNRPVESLKDSKKLSPKRRAELFEEIKQSADIGFGWVEAKEIDEIGLSKAMGVAVSKALEELSPKTDEEIIMDGSVNYVDTKYNAKAIIKADDTIACVSAASIAAKVTRDEFMKELAKKYPFYGFEKHVGYGTKLHKATILQHGYCDQHRRSFRLPSKGTDR